MQELIERITVAEAAAQAGLAACIFLPRVPARRLSLFFDIKAVVPVEQKEILCALRLYSADATLVAAQGSNWPISSRLQAPYQYLPSVGDRELVRLKSFANAEPFAAAVIHLHPWKRRFADGDITLLRCVASERVTLNGRPFMQYLDLPALEMARD